MNSDPATFSLSQSQVDAFHRDGLLVVDELIDPALIGELRTAFDRVFNGKFQTGVRPDEVNWQYGSGDPGLTRQICNGWKSDRALARVVLSAAIGEAIARLADWPGTRVIQDNVLWKPPGARTLGYHRDNAYLAWYTPQEMMSCWIALDTTTASGGTMELARGSHLWRTDCDASGEFHDPADYRKSVTAAAKAENKELEVVYVEVPEGGGVFHHGWTWHGSGRNCSERQRRALVIHGASSHSRFVPDAFGKGNGPVYSRYRRLTDDVMDENHFPVTWSVNGHRSAGLD